VADKLTIGSLIYKLGFSGEEEFVAGLEAVLKKAEGTTEKAGGDAGKAGGRAAGKGFSDQFKATFSGAALGSFLGGALQQAFSGAISAAQRFAVDSVREFAVYEQGLLQLKLAGETNLTALSQRIQATAKATKVFSATDVSIAVGELVKAGYDAETAFKLVETGALGAASEVDAMTGRFGDLTSTAGQLGNILRALGLDTSQSARVMDVLAKAAQDSNLNVSDLVDIVSRVGPTAKLAGLEIEDLAAMAGVLANNGMEASLIGTGLRSVLQSLINPSGQVKGELDKLGISLVDSQGNLRDFNDVLDGLHDLTERGGEGLQLLTAATGSFGSAAAANLGSASETVKEFRRSMEGAEGTAHQLADTMRNSGAGAAAEMQASIANARAELGEQLMPILLELNTSVLPVLVGLLGGIVEKWTQWEFLLTGTTSALKQQQDALNQSIAARLGDEWMEAWNRRLDILQRIGELEGQLANWDRSTDWLGLGKGRAESELAALRVELAGVESELEGLNNQRRTAQELANRQAGWAADADTAFGPQGMPEGWTPQTVNDVAEAYRNLARIQEELKAAQEALANASGPEEEARLKALVAALTAEEEARKRNLGLIKDTVRAQAAAKDPLIEEAQRVQNDLQRLKLGYEQGTMTREQYVEAMEAHVRRLDGLYDKVANPTQSLAVLRARQAFLDEQSRLVKESTVKLEVKPVATVDQAMVDRAAAQAEARERNNQRMLDALTAQEQAYYTWQEQQAQEKAEKQAAITAELLAIEGAQQDYALQQWVERQQKAAQEEKERQEAIAEARARNNQRVIDELMAQEAAYTAYLASEAEKRAAKEAELAAGRAFRAQQEARQRALANLYPGYAGNPASSYTTLAERASGSLVKLAQAQRTLGVATRDDVQAALEGQIAAIERLLPIVEEGSDRYYDLVAALQAAKSALDALSGEVPDFVMPDLSSPEAIRRAVSTVETTISGLKARLTTETDQSVIALLETRITQYTALLQQLGIAVTYLGAAAVDGKTREEIAAAAAQLADQLTDIAASFPKAIVSGIQNGDISGALRNALGNASDFFLDQMLQAILGPITEQLTASIAASMAAQSTTGAAGAATGAIGALGPTGWVLGGLALVASLLIGSSQRKEIAERPATAAKAAVSGAPSVTYNLTGNVTVNSSASWSDPAFQARWRAETEALLVSLLSKVRR
jgi:TP901 family phage tail tape measure protein